jgi:transposase-like protein
VLAPSTTSSNPIVPRAAGPARCGGQVVGHSFAESALSGAELGDHPARVWRRSPPSSRARRSSPVCFAYAPGQIVVSSRWPRGFECPVCGGGRYSLVTTRDLYQCTKCRRQTSPIAGTIFASTHQPLRLWFRAIYHLTQTKQGISSIELGRRLGVTQTTAWKIKHKLKQVMLERDATKRLTGRVEIDDAYLGGERSGGKRGRGAPD